MKKLRSWLLATLLVGASSFLWGTHVGDQHRTGIREVLHGWFGLGQPPGVAGATHEEPSAKADAGPEQESKADSQNAMPQVTGVSGADAQNAKPQDQASVGALSTAEAHSPTQAMALAQADPPSGLPLALPVTVRVKIVVDDRYARKHSDWLTRVQRTVALTAAAYRKAVQVDLELAGVVRFMEPLDGLDSSELQRMLRRHPREGADVVLGFVDRTLPAKACTASPLGAHGHGTYGLVGLSALRGTDHLGDGLRCIGRLLGAALIADPELPAFQSGSWMRSTPLSPGTLKPWLDGQSRARIMARKPLAFSEDLP